MGRRAFKRSLLGYSRAEVDAAIAERDDAIVSMAADVGAAREELAELVRARDALDALAGDLAERLEERERELGRLRGELAAAQERARRADAVAAAGGDAASAQAREQATRIRLRALRDAAELSERIAMLTRRPAVARERLLNAVEEAIARLGEEGPAPVFSANGNGHHPDPDPDPGELFDGLVEVEVGPLRDFAQLVGFEDAASMIGATSEISVKRFAQGRATLELRLRQPVELLRELEERAPFDFVVRDTRDRKLILDVDTEGE